MSLGPENRLYLKNKGFRTILSCKLNIVFILKQANTNQIGLFQRFRTGTKPHEKLVFQRAYWLTCEYIFHQLLQLLH